LRLQFLEQLLGVPNVVERSEPECAFAVCAAGVKFNLFVVLENASKSLNVALVVCTVLKREI
jgi:hypothetical protein